MYSYIKGTIVDIQSDHIVLENNGIGYLVYVSNPYAFSKGKEMIVYVYQQVKEDGILFCILPPNFRGLIFLEVNYYDCWKKH